MEAARPKCNRPPTTPLLCDETTLRQSAPLHRTSVSREKSLFDVYRRHHQANLNLIFPGYDVDSSYCIKISRDADILIDDTASSADLVAQLKKKVKKRKIGDVCRFVYDVLCLLNSWTSLWMPSVFSVTNLSPVISI